MTAEAKALVEAHLPRVSQVVRSMAAHYPRHADRDELMQAAALGLVEAACRFDTSRGVPFERWASVRIRGAVVDAVRDRDMAPRGLRSAAREVEEARAALQRDHGRQPTTEELATRVGMTPQQINALAGRVHRSMVLSLDAPTGGATGDTMETLGSTVIDEAQLQPIELLEQREQNAYLGDALACLPERLRTIVSGYFLEGRTSAELAEELGVTESRISQLRTEALELMRKGLTAQFSDQPAAPAETATGRAAYRAEAYAAAVAERSSFSLRLAPVPAPRRSADEPLRHAV
jgi:RNA polymerase sigma factor for flagellar operon FliA